jgi:predicted metal-binding membrane protein
MNAVVRRDRWIVLSGLATVVALAWVYLAVLALGMRSMDTMSMGTMSMSTMTLPQAALPQMQTWGATDVLLTFVMWAVMMAAMMVPSASPMVLMISATARRRNEARPHLITGLFLLGYLVIWTLFSALAVAGQGGLHAAALLSPGMVSTSSVLGGGLLLAAGVFQWTPLKHACLGHCRTPLGFVLNEWRDGGGGAFRMGLKHGAFCVGCCWALMTLLFVAGVMNLAWVAVIAAFVLVEKIVPAGPWIGRVAGVALGGLGLWMLLPRVLGA